MLHKATLGVVTAAAEDEDESEVSKPRPFSTKVYVVTAPSGHGGMEVVDVKLSWSSADKVAETITGAIVKKWVATK